MSKSMIGAQMYTLREFTKTPKDIASTMAKVKAMGYDAVQLSALGRIDPRELKGILDGEGLTVAATHVGFEKLRDDTQAMIDEHHLLGCMNPAIGGMPSEYWNPDGFLRFAGDASVVARKLKAAGLSFSYHNHSAELEKINGKRILDILLDESDPAVVSFEIDTYWIQHGGGDPAAWIRRAGAGGRPMPVVHFKDMAIVNREQVMSEVGEGNLNWQEIVQACRDSGVEWYLIEQDICRRDPFESMAMSLRNVKAMGIP